MSSLEIPTELEATRIVAIMRRIPETAAVRTAEALVAGGVSCLEVTCDSPGAFEMITAISRAVGERVRVGAGTVLDVSNASAAIGAGASFIVSPHTDANLIEWASAHGVPFIPGAFTPTEVLAAWRAGAVLVKLFPAGSVGPEFVKDLRGPLREIPLLPTGGITLENASAFLQAGAWGLGIGSALVAGDDYAEIERRARRFIEIAARHR